MYHISAPASGNILELVLKSSEKRRIKMNNTGTKKKGMRLKSKLTMVYILAGFLPIVVILFVNYFQMRSVFKIRKQIPCIVL